MTKIKINPKSYLYPMPVVIVGSIIDKKINFMTIAYCNIVEHNPPTIFISASKNHYKNEGIRKNKTFSVNTPSEEIIEGTDYCGIISGKEADKSDVFEVFYGELKTAPMISKAPLNLECRVIKTIAIKELTGAEKGHEFFIGEVVNAYAEEKYLTEGAPDISKINTFTYSMKQYWKVGKPIAKAWEVGKKLMTD